MPNPGNRRREKRDVRHECETGYVRQETWERRQDTRYKIQETWIKRQEITARCCCGAKILKVAHVAMEQIKVASDKNWKNGPFKDKKNYLGPTCSCNSAASRRTDCFVKRKCRLNSRSGRVRDHPWCAPRAADTGAEAVAARSQWQCLCPSTSGGATFIG